MFRCILVPLDGSKLSEASLSAAAVLAKGLDSSITLLHVIEQDAPPSVHKERHLTDAGEAAAYLKQIAAQALPSAIRVDTHVHTAPVADVVRSIVAHSTSEFKADLIIICTHGRGGMHDLLFGSIAQQIVAQGTTPLLLIKPDASPFQIDRILVPLDPESAHDDGLSTAAELAISFEASLELVSIIPKFSTLTGEQAAASSLMPATTLAMLDLQEQLADEHLTQHADTFKQRGVRCVATVARGDPAAVIVGIAQHGGADLIVLSTHRKAGLEAFWSRSVAPKVAQRTKTPLLLLPLQ